MEPENTNPNPNQPVTPHPAPAGNHEGSVGPAVATFIILAVIILGGIYFWSQRGEQAVPAENNEASQIEAQSTSDAISDIEADLNATDLENLDAELNGAY